LKILEVVSRPEFAQDHESGLRSDRGPVVLCDFSKLRFWKSPYDFLNLYGRFCPYVYNPPYWHTNPGKKSAPPLFLEDDNIFQKSASVVVGGIAVELQPRRPIFEKCSHLREKRGGADAFENDPPFRNKGTVDLPGTFTKQKSLQKKVPAPL
jgi:hypothetical protein